MLEEMKHKLKIRKSNKKFRKINKHNFCFLINDTDINKIKVGKESYGPINVITYGNDGNLIIGNYCSIARETTFLLGGEHNYKNVSTFPFKKIFKDETEAFSKGNIILKDDVWIGYGTTILSGVTIGQGAVIGANSIVAKDVPPYAIYVGNKILKYRFDEEIIKKLMGIDYSKLDREKIIKNIDLFYGNVNEEKINKIKELED